MRALNLLTQSQGNLLADYTARMGEAMLRQRAETEIHAARAEADIAIRARAEFLANMNHELRTPLNAIIGFASMLRHADEYKFSEEQKDEYVGFILQSADLLLGHINTLLAVAALDSGAVEIRDEEFDLSDVLASSLEGAKMLAEANKVELERRDESAEILAWGDAERTGQAVDHLLQTAVRACADGGRVFVRACMDEAGWAEVAVRDDSEGLDPDEIADALEAFNEAHRGLDRSFSGPGVGYAVAKAFVEMQGGRFRIKSRKGHGTLVRISLPPAKEHADAGSGPAQEHETNMERANDAA